MTSLPIRVFSRRQLVASVVFSEKTPSLLRTRALSHATIRPKAPIQVRIRSFSTTLIHLKSKHRKEHVEPVAAQDAGSEESPSEQEVNPFDFSKMEEGLEAVREKLKRDIAKLNTGARFNTEQLEDLRVTLDKQTKKTERLGDLAQVLPKPQNVRSLGILVGEQDHIKAIVSAIQNFKDMSLQPQLDPENHSQLIVRLPSPTKESRIQEVAAAGRAGEVAREGVRSVRAVMQKSFRAMTRDRSVRGDDIRKAGKEMEKIIQTALTDNQQIVDQAKKTIGQI